MIVPVSIEPNVTAYVFRGNPPDAEAVQALFRYAERFSGHEVLGFIDEMLRPSSSKVARQHNLVTTAGLAALAYNCSGAGEADGDTFGFDSSGVRCGSLLVGSGTTEAALADAALGTLQGTYEDHWTIATEHLLVLGYHLTGPKRNALATSAVTVSELGIKTAASGSGKASDDILFARCVFDAGDYVEVSSDTAVVYIWNFAYRWAERSGEQGLDQGLHYFATRMHNLATYGAVDRFQLGSGATKLDAWATDLVASTHNITATWAAAGAALSASGTLLTGAGAGASVLEAAPKVNGLGPLYQARGAHIAGDNVANDLAWSGVITFANVETADALNREQTDGLLRETGDALLLESV